MVTTTMHCCIVGEGAFYRVYASRTNKKQPLALKVPKFGKDVRFALRLKTKKREVREPCLKSLPNGVWLVQTMQQFMDREQRYLERAYHAIGPIFGLKPYSQQGEKNIATELGPFTLQHIIKSGRFNTEQCIAAMIQLLVALLRLHNAGIIHGDIKAENCVVWLPQSDQVQKLRCKDINVAVGSLQLMPISLSSLGIVKLIDYGCAYDANDITAQQCDFDQLETMLFKTQPSKLLNAYRRILNSIRLEQAKHKWRRATVHIGNIH